MKTVFKVGMKVYDQIVFPNKKGVITEIGKGNVCPLVVKVEDINLYYKLNGVFGSGTTPTLSIKPYKVEFQGFEQKAPAPTLEDAINWLRDNDLHTASVEDSRVIYFTKKENYFAFDALRKLIILRDYYNEGWQPNYIDNKRKSVIFVTNNEIEKGFSIAESNVLTFKTEEIRDKFLEEQKELLEIAKPLL